MDGWAEGGGGAILIVFGFVLIAYAIGIVVL